MYSFFLLVFLPLIHGGLRPENASCWIDDGMTAVSLNSDDIFYFESKNYPTHISHCGQKFAVG